MTHAVVLIILIPFSFPQAAQENFEAGAEFACAFLRGDDIYRFGIFIVRRIRQIIVALLIVPRRQDQLQAAVTQFRILAEHHFVKVEGQIDAVQLVRLH